MSRLIKYTLIVLALALALRPDSSPACAMCYGTGVDTPLTQGMNAGIFVLLGMISCVLCGIASFAIFLARRSASMPALPVPQATPIQSIPMVVALAANNA